MTEVIVLSDDDELQLSDRILIGGDDSSGATVHIKETNQINLAQLGICSTILKSAPQARVRVNNHRAPLRHDNRLTPLGKRQNGDVVETIRLEPVKRAKTNGKTSIWKKYGASDTILLCQTIEASEATQPQRRSNRVENSKKIEGKFVCKYDPNKCVKVIDGTVEFTNHLWAHVIYDDQKKKKNKIGGGGKEAAEYLEPAASFLQQLSTCEYCMTKFSRVYQKQIHVLKCHLSPTKKGIICHVCEVEIPPTFIQHHIEQHREVEAPYHCRKCKYRTSVRIFMYEHYAEKHNMETLMCPICLFQVDLPIHVRKRRLIFVESFVEHMKSHSSGVVHHRCPSCSLNFVDANEYRLHLTKDHTQVPSSWTITERQFVGKKAPKVQIAKLSKISELQKCYSKTLEGRRVDDEVACSSSIERSGFDTSSSGNVLYKCDCGQLASFNGNRVASHFHRCRQEISETIRETNKGFEYDDEEELKKFAVYPPFAETELRRKKKKNEKKKEEKQELEIKSEWNQRSKIDDFGLLKCLTSNEEISVRVEQILASYTGDK